MISFLNSRFSFFRIVPLTDEKSRYLVKTVSYIEVKHIIKKMIVYIMYLNNLLLF